MDAVIVEEASMTREALDQTFVRTHTDRLRLLRLLSMNLYDIYHKQSGKWYCIQLSYSTVHTLMMTLAVYADWPIKLTTEYCVIIYKYHRLALMNLLSGITGKSVIFVFLGGVSDRRQFCKDFNVKKEKKYTEVSI